MKTSVIIVLLGFICLALGAAIVKEESEAVPVEQSKNTVEDATEIESKGFEDSLPDDEEFALPDDEEFDDFSDGPSEEYEVITEKDSPVEESTQEDSPVEESTQEDSPVEESTQEDSPAEESTQEESPVEESTQEDSLVEESTQEDSLVEESTQEDSPVEESPEEDKEEIETPKEMPEKDSEEKNKDEVNTVKGEIEIPNEDTEAVTDKLAAKYLPAEDTDTDEQPEPTSDITIEQPAEDLDKQAKIISEKQPASEKDESTGMAIATEDQPAEITEDKTDTEAETNENKSEEPTQKEESSHAHEKTQVKLRDAGEKADEYSLEELML